MERFTGYEELKNIWTYDHARVNNVIGCIRDPYAITTESGIEMVPASIGMTWEAVVCWLDKGFAFLYYKLWKALSCLIP